MLWPPQPTIKNFTSVSPGGTHIGRSMWVATIKIRKP